MPCTKCEEGNYKWGETGECEYATKEACESANSKYNKMQPTPLGKKTYEEYEKELKEYNLSSSKRIDLGLTDDAKTVVKEGKAVQKQLSSQMKVWTKIEGEYSKVFAKILDFLDDTKGTTQDAEKIRDEANTIYNKLEKSAKELGVNINDIPVAKQLDETGVDLNELINDIDFARSQAKDV